MLMNQISPDMCSLDGLDIPDLVPCSSLFLSLNRSTLTTAGLQDQRAEFVVANAFKLGCNPFVTPYDIVQVRSGTYRPQPTSIDCSHRTPTHAENTHTTHATGQPKAEPGLHRYALPQVRRVRREAQTR